MYVYIHTLSLYVCLLVCCPHHPSLVGLVAGSRGRRKSKVNPFLSKPVTIEERLSQLSGSGVNGGRMDEGGMFLIPHAQAQPSLNTLCFYSCGCVCICVCVCLHIYVYVCVCVMDSLLVAFLFIFACDILAFCAASRVRGDAPLIPGQFVKDSSQHYGPSIQPTPRETKLMAEKILSVCPFASVSEGYFPRLHPWLLPPFSTVLVTWMLHSTPPHHHPTCSATSAVPTTNL